MGNWVVWRVVKEVTEKGHDVLIFNLAIKRKISLGPRYCPAIGESKVGWLDNRSSAFGPYLIKTVISTYMR